MATTKLEKKVDEFRGKITAIQKAIRQIKRTGIEESVLYLIIQRSSQRFQKSRYTNPISVGDIKAVIAGIENLQEYMFVELEKSPNS